MNPRLVLHLFSADWQRLRWFLVLAWLGMLLAALPALRFDAGDAVPGSMFYRGYSGIDDEGEQKALVELLGTDRHVVRYPGAAYAPFLLPLLLAGISASLGFNGSGWARVRPLRWQERALAALSGLLAFIVLPQCAVIAANLLAQGFNSGDALRGAVRAGMLLLPLHAGSLVLGRVCGSLWRWFAAIVGIAVITGLLSILPYLPYWWRSTGLFSIGWWGQIPGQVTAVVITLAVLVLVVALFRGGHRPRLRLALVMLAVVLTPPWARMTYGGPGFDPKVLRNVPAHPQASSIRAEYVPGSLFFHQTYEREKTSTTLEAQVITSGLPEDEKMMWVLEEAGPFTHQGKMLPQKWGWYPTRRGRNITPGGLPMQPADVVPLPFKVASGNREWSSMTKRWVIGEFDLGRVSTTGPQLDMDAGLLGIAMRYREVLREPFQDKIDLEPAGLKEGHARVIRSGPLAPAVDMSYLLGPSSHGSGIEDDRHPMRSFRCFLHLGGDRYVESRDLYHGGHLLLSQASAMRRVVKFDGVKEGDLADARLVLVRLEVTGSVRSRMKAAGLPLPPARDFRGNRYSSPAYLIGPSREEWRYPEGRPSPDSATEDQVGQWFMQVLNTHDRTLGRELAPFVRRFPDMFIGFKGEPYNMEPVTQALVHGLPESQRQKLLDAFAKESDPGASPLLPVILQRGWQDGCRETVLRGLRDKPSDGLVAAAASYGDPSLHSDLLDAMDRLQSRRAYFAIRRLPGIGEALSRKVEEGFARDRPAFLAEPDSGEQALKLSVPAAHGSPDAFALLFPPSKKVLDHGGTPEALHILMQITSAPPDITTWQAWAAFIKAREATDFHYDAFAGVWFPNNSKHSKP